MLRGILNMLVSTLLLITTTGFGISRHYCGTTLVSVHIEKEADSCCGEGADCCHNENEFFQVKDDFVVAANPISFENSFALDVLFYQPIHFSISTFSDNTDVLIVFNESPPPPLIQTTLSSLQTYRL
jgi:hypothetical protein